MLSLLIHKRFFLKATYKQLYQSLPERLIYICKGRQYFAFETINAYFFGIECYQA
jgi:hypothetical protein